MSQNNYSIHSIAAAYAVGLFPHGYYYVKMMANAKEHATNIVYAYNNPYQKTKTANRTIQTAREPVQPQRPPPSPDLAATRQSPRSTSECDGRIASLRCCNGKAGIF